MAHSGTAQPDITDDLAREAADLATATGSLRKRARELHRRAAGLRDRLAKAGIGFTTEDTRTTTAHKGEGSTR